MSNHNTTIQLHKDTALRLIHRNLKNGKFVLREHFKDRLNERNLYTQDAIYVLENGIIIAEPRFDDKLKNHSYKVEGYTVDDEWLAVVVALDDDKIIFITTFDD